MSLKIDDSPMPVRKEAPPMAQSSPAPPSYKEAVANDPPALRAVRPPAAPGLPEHRDALEVPPEPAPESSLCDSFTSCFKKLAVATGKCLFALLQALVKLIYRICPEEVLDEPIRHNQVLRNENLDVLTTIQEEDSPKA